MTRLSVLPTDSSGESFDSVSSYLQALLEHTATTMDELSQTIVRGESERAKASESVAALAERLGLLVEQLHTQQALLARLADTQIELKPILGRLSEEQSFGRQELVTALRTEFKNLANRIAEVQLQIRPYLDQMTKDNAVGRQEMIREMRSETEVLAQAIATLAGARDRREADQRVKPKA
jgi:chromosome segregation ATPase